MIIKVTEEHLKNGKKRAAYECFVALALNEATGQKWCVGTTACCRQNPPNNYILPLEVRRKIRQFDRDTDVEPFEFELEI